MILLVDNYDSFTYNLADYFRQLGRDVSVVRNDELNLGEVTPKRYEAIVLSPGPGRPAEAGICPELVKTLHSRMPILGVCLGMQVLVECYGGTVDRAVYPMHGKVSELEVEPHWLFEGIQGKIEVCRYHSLVATTLDHPKVDVIARSSLGEIMAIAHRQYPVVGLQFHPEAILTAFGLDMLGNWLKRFTLHQESRGT